MAHAQLKPVSSKNPERSNGEAWDITINLEDPILASESLVRILEAYLDAPGFKKEHAAFLIFRLGEQIDTIKAQWDQLFEATKH